ncbi:uncharacterized protein LOC117290187 [Asterias rubens]|uniref:uncharacterized protein LOC117290187 n=1 Tax=Asterias rubens TaxID=7604 RepID=UPI0014551EB7|nr:uncharacterized protein LOC117290187 [Asterias rubens]
MAAQSEEHTVVKSEQVSAVFVTLILKHPVLLNKSQLPSIKEKKWNALQDAKAIIAKTTGKNMDDKQILKKVANMKVQVKKKMEAAKTGNQTINLRSWEKDLFYALKGQKTPTCTTTHKMASAISAGFCSSSCASADVSFGGLKNSSGQCGSKSASTSPQSQFSTPLPLRGSKRKSLGLPGETEETMNLSTTKLQRLVLLEQLNYTRMKIRRLEENKQTAQEDLSSGSTDAMHY